MLRAGWAFVGLQSMLKCKSKLCTHPIALGVVHSFLSPLACSGSV